MQHSWHLPRIFHTHCTKVTLNNLLVTKSLVNLLEPHQPKWRLQCQGMMLHGPSGYSPLLHGQSSFGFPRWRFHSRRQKLFTSLLLPESQWMVNNFVEKVPGRGEAERQLQTDSCPTYLRDLKPADASGSHLQKKASKWSWIHPTFQIKRNIKVLCRMKCWTTLTTAQLFRSVILSPVKMLPKCSKQRPTGLMHCGFKSLLRLDLPSLTKDFRLAKLPPPREKCPWISLAWQAWGLSSS